MRRFIYLVSVVAMLLGISGASFAMMMCGSGGHKGEAQAQPASEATTDAGNTMCPVSNEHIEQGKEIKVEHEGKAYNLCCKACMKDFKKDPQKYIGKLEAQSQEEKETSGEEGRSGHEGHTGHSH